MVRDANHDEGALPPPLAGEGWGEGVSTRENPQEGKAPSRAFGSPRRYVTITQVENGSANVR